MLTAIESIAAKVLHDYNVFLDCIAYASQVRFDAVLVEDGSNHCTVDNIGACADIATAARVARDASLTSYVRSRWRFTPLCVDIGKRRSIVCAVTLDVRAKFGPLAPDVAPSTQCRLACILFV